MSTTGRKRLVVRGGLPHGGVLFYAALVGVVVVAAGVVVGLAGYFYLTSVEVPLVAGEYPVDTPVAGAVGVAMGPGRYVVEVVPGAAAGLEANVSCAGDPGVWALAAPGEPATLYCRDGVVVVYTGVARAGVEDVGVVRVVKR